MSFPTPISAALILGRGFAEATDVAVRVSPTRGAERVDFQSPATRANPPSSVGGCSVIGAQDVMKKKPNETFQRNVYGVRSN